MNSLPGPEGRGRLLGVGEVIGKREQMRDVLVLRTVLGCICPTWASCVRELSGRCTASAGRSILLFLPVGLSVSPLLCFQKGLVMRKIFAVQIKN